MSNTIPVAVRRGDFQRCYETTIFCAWAYKSTNHLHAEMEHPKYFSQIRQRLVAGDHIYAIDAAMEYKTYVVDLIDEAAQEVRLSVLHTHSPIPIMAEGEELAWRWRGPKGGGHCIVDRQGGVVERDFPSRQQAEYEIERRKILAEASPAAA